MSPQSPFFCLISKLCVPLRHFAILFLVIKLKVGYRGANEAYQNIVFYKFFRFNIYNFGLLNENFPNILGMQSSSKGKYLEFNDLLF